MGDLLYVKVENSGIRGILKTDMLYQLWKILKAIVPSIVIMV